MSRGLYDPEALVAKKVHRPFERSESHPRTGQFLPILSSVLWIEESSVPLRILLDQMPGRTGSSCSWTKICRCLWEVIFDRATVVPVGVTRVN
jgi:hypothetical protein